MNSIRHTINESKEETILAHLQVCDASFAPPLSTYVNLKDYTAKICSRAIRLELKLDGKLIGLLALYKNAAQGTAFITNLSIDPHNQKAGFGQLLLRECLSWLRENLYHTVTLEVNHKNLSAIRFYTKFGFKPRQSHKTTLFMELNLPRNYDRESGDTKDHKYAYNFDFDVMHHYMLESFRPHFRDGSCLELGSFRGDFTKRLRECFSDITCVEASTQAIEEAQKTIGPDIEIIPGLFETVKLARRFDNIILTHVLEHIDEPVDLLKRIRRDWLAKNGRLFIACPNANAPSRQIAVKMGLISHNTAITSAEKEHGHRITYSLDTLERDATGAGLHVTLRSGIFFKALANFQWDQLLRTQIISREYLDGCFKLGQQYPDLCSSIFLVCEHPGSPL